MQKVHTVLRRQLEQEGYIVLPHIVPAENLSSVIKDICSHTSIDLNKSTTWYKPAVINTNSMVEMYHYQSMWDNRQHPAIHKVFAEIFGTEKLWVNIDRITFKLPMHNQYPEANNRGLIHWDVDIRKYPSIRFGVQGTLALTDTDEDMGSFQCVPELYQELDTWVKRHQGGPQPLLPYPNLSGYPITKIPLHAGDMVIWRNLLPHSNGINRSPQPQLAQYISMSLAHEDDIQTVQTRINCWQKNTPPPNPFFPGDPRRIEEKREQPAHLTALGRKLLGTERWR
jgi:ectoine hydroxylase-related dioxygenase (phytanoyl-CoA dioxygenase family)